MNNKIYRISDGRLWDVSAAAYIDEVPQGLEAMDLVSAEGDNSEAYLIRQLEFYGHPLGELAGRSVSGIKKLSSQVF